MPQKASRYIRAMARGAWVAGLAGTLAETRAKREQATG